MGLGDRTDRTFPPTGALISRTDRGRLRRATKALVAKADSLYAGLPERIKINHLHRLVDELAHSAARSALDESASELSDQDKDRIRDLFADLAHQFVSEFTGVSTVPKGDRSVASRPPSLQPQPKHAGPSRHDPRAPDDDPAGDGA
jgi:hypothetical protein